MIEFLFGSVFVPVLMTIAGVYAGKSSEAWFGVLFGVITAYAAGWGGLAIDDWEVANGESAVTYAAKLVSFAGVGYGIAFTVVATLIAAEQSMNPPRSSGR